MLVVARVVKVKGRAKWSDLQWNDVFYDTYRAIETHIHCTIYSIYVHDVHFVEILLELELFIEKTLVDLFRKGNGSKKEFFRN